MKLTHRHMKYFTLSLFLLTSLIARSQPKFNSPYSRNGIGDITRPYFANQAGFGGQTAAFHDPFHLNLDNPASFAFLRSTALETGIFTQLSQYKSSNSAQDEWSGNLAYLALGFTLKSPINEVLDKKKSIWNYGMGVSLTPYSRVGYNVQTREILPDIEDVQNNFEGSGGLYRIAWSSAAKRKNTALGLNLGWLFGKTTYENTTRFFDTSSVRLPTFQNNIRQDIAANGFVWRLGAQHDFVLKHAENDKNVPIRWITIGLSGEGQQHLNATENQFHLRSRGRNINGTFTDADTLSFISGEKRKIRLPSSIALGVQYVKVNKLKLGVQIGLENWSNYLNEARPETMRNTLSVSGGAEFIPNYSSYNKFLKRVRYRTGAYYRQDPRNVGETALDDIGLTLGMGLPLVLPRQQTSFINLALEVGKFGTNSPIEETYFRLTAGFTLNDNTWFYKRRFE